jgi:hypothetical protein
MEWTKPIPENSPVAELIAVFIPTTCSSIFSSAENVSSLDNDLREILRDSSDSCEYTAYVDKDGITQIKIECIVSEEEVPGSNCE